MERKNKCAPFDSANPICFKNEILLRMLELEIPKVSASSWYLLR